MRAHILGHGKFSVVLRVARSHTATRGRLATPFARQAPLYASTTRGVSLITLAFPVAALLATGLGPPDGLGSRRQSGRSRRRFGVGLHHGDVVQCSAEYSAWRTRQQARSSTAWTVIMGWPSDVDKVGRGSRRTDGKQDRRRSVTTADLRNRRRNWTYQRPANLAAGGGDMAAQIAGACPCSTTPGHSTQNHVSLRTLALAPGLWACGGVSPVAAGLPPRRLPGRYLHARK